MDVKRVRPDNHEPNAIGRYLGPLGRVLLALIFVVSGIHKLTQWSGTIAPMTAKGLPFVPVLLAISVALEVGGGLLIMIGYRTHVVALLLFLYMIPVTVVFHDFWRYQGFEMQFQLVNFLKNLSIMGGLLTLAVTSPIAVSVDAARARKPASVAT
jgi:putative oxidoreductase